MSEPHAGRAVGGPTPRGWWRLLGPLEVPVECNGERHRLRWHEGLLEVPDHPDPEGERTLGALGASTSPCIDLFDVWQRHHDDLGVLVLASRGPGDQPVPPAGLARTGPLSSGPAVFGPGPMRRLGPGVARAFGAAALQGQDDLLLLLETAGGLWDRLVATVVATWAQRAAEDDPRCAPARPAMAAALYGRATGTVRRLLGDPGLAVDVEMAPPGGDPAIGWDGGRVGLRLPFAWLRDVWVPGLGLLVGRLSLAMLESGPDRYRVSTVGPDLLDRRPVTVTVG